MITEFYAKEFINFHGEKGKLTIATGPVIIDSTNKKVLLHISETTEKYQFIGGKLDDSLSFQENALMRAREVVGTNIVRILEHRPIIILDEIERNGEKEQILLVHYKASIDNEIDIGEGKWFNLDELKELDKNKQTSSPNILICSSHFLNTLNK